MHHKGLHLAFTSPSPRLHLAFTSLGLCTSGTPLVTRQVRHRHGSLGALLDSGGGIAVLHDALPPTVALRIEASLRAISQDEWVDTRCSLTDVLAY